MTTGRTGGGFARRLALTLAAALPLGSGASAAELASPWSDGYNSRARLIAGTFQSRLHAGIELSIAKGWKTYWRSPGDSGGVPPNFDFSLSENLASAKVLYPAPARLTDAAGDAVGYKDAVVFPVEIAAIDPAKPVVVTAQVEYGICREICVPAEARLSLVIEPGAATSTPSALKAALDRVPIRASPSRPGGPLLKSARAELSGDRPKLVFEIAYPGGSSGADLFVEAPEGIYLPVPHRTGEDNGSVMFDVGLPGGVDAKSLTGKTLILTAVSQAGQSETAWTVP